MGPLTIRDRIRHWWLRQRGRFCDHVFEEDWTYPVEDGWRDCTGPICCVKCGCDYVLSVKLRNPQQGDV